MSVRGMRKHYHTDRGLFRAVQGVDVEVAPEHDHRAAGPLRLRQDHAAAPADRGAGDAHAGAIAFDGVDMTQRSIQDRDVGFTSRATRCSST